MRIKIRHNRESYRREKANLGAVSWSLTPRADPGAGRQTPVNPYTRRNWPRATHRQRPITRAFPAEIGSNASIRCVRAKAYLEQQGKSEMGPFTTLDFPEGKIAFIGTIRVNDEGVNEFCADLPGRPSLYGEWQPIFEPNGNDLNVKIASFGYSDRSNVGNPHPGAKIRLSEEEKHSIEILLHKLFECSEIRNGVFPFSSRKARFLGRLFFDDQWALD